MIVDVFYIHGGFDREYELLSYFDVFYWHTVFRSFCQLFVVGRSINRSSSGLMLQLYTLSLLLVPTFFLLTFVGFGPVIPSFLHTLLSPHHRSSLFLFPRVLTGRWSCLLAWCLCGNIPRHPVVCSKWLVLDGGSNFDNELSDELTELLDIYQLDLLPLGSRGGGERPTLDDEDNMQWTVIYCGPSVDSGGLCHQPSPTVPHPVLGDHNAVEMMTDRKSDSAVA